MTKIIPNEKPLEKSALNDLINVSGLKIDMILTQEIGEDNKPYFLIFVRYNKNLIVRQVYTQRKDPRKFKDIKRALDWGKRIGFNSVSMYLDFSLYPYPEIKESI